MTPRTTAFVLAWLALGTTLQAAPPDPATFSIVAADPAAGEVGIAVASRFFAVGSVVPYGRAGQPCGRPPAGLLGGIGSPHLESC